MFKLAILLFSLILAVAAQTVAPLAPGRYFITNVGEGAAATFVAAGTSGVVDVLYTSHASLLE